MQDSEGCGCPDPAFLDPEIVAMADAAMMRARREAFEQSDMADGLIEVEMMAEAEALALS